MGNMIKEKLEQIKKYSGLSQNKFANRIGVDSGAMSRILKGGGFGYEVLERIAVEFPEISMDWLLKNEGEMLTGNSSKSVQELKTEVNWLKEQLSKALSANESTAKLKEEMQKYQRNIVDIYKILEDAGVNLEELVKTSTRRAV